MLFLIALIIAFCFAFFCGKALKKYPYIFYGLSVVITAITVILAGSDLRSVPEFINTYIIGLFTRGAFATALWCVVMWTGALPNGSALIKKFMPIRGELSIFAALLTLGHNIGFGQTYFVRLFTDAGRMSSNQVAAGVITIILLVIMIPLTVMSFPQIRKKMSAKLWKKIQRTAYAFYALLYIHVILLCYPLAKAGREGYLFSIFMYSIVFIGYAVCRLRKWYIVRKKPEKVMVLNIICAVFFVVIVAAVTFCSRGEASKPRINTTEVQNEYTFTVTTEVSGTSQITTTTVTGADTSSSAASTVTETGTTTTTVTDVTEVVTDPIQDDIEEDDEWDYEEYDNYDDYDNYDNYDNYDDNQTYDSGDNQSPAQDPGPSYIYNNGTYSASAYGYDGDVHVTITIENDVITSISGYTDEIDSWYYESAQGSVISQILSTQSTNVDAYSGATYSSNAIMSAVQSALNSAKN